MENSYLGAYWGNRPESALEGAERLAACMAALARLDGAFSSWFKKGSRRASANTPVDLEHSSLAAVLEGGRNRRDVGREVIDELGFSLALWNGSQPEIGMTGLVGAYPSVPGILNVFLLNFHSSEGSDPSRLYETAIAKAVMEAVVEAWEPDWATWSTSRLRDAQPVEPREPVVGWYTYLRGDVAPKVSAGVVEPLGRGFLIRSGVEFGAVDEAAVLRLRKQLRSRRALRPIPFP